MNFPDFKPHPFLPGGHVQTVAGVYLGGHSLPYRAVQHRVPLEDGDQLVLHDDCPADWASGDRVVLLVHGLGGSHASGYMIRVAAKLNAIGVRTFRMDLRGAGAGIGLARLPYHSGRSDDAAAALRFLAGLCRRSPVTLVGFSLGGNIVLKLLGELGPERCGELDSGLAICPPIDLTQSSIRIRERGNRMYDRHFARQLLAQLVQRCRSVPDAAVVPFSRRPRGLWEFDDLFTARVCGFGTAENYYLTASSARVVSRIRLPTLVLASHDDPLIPSRMFSEAAWPRDVHLLLTRRGGHLGFIARPGADPDRRWMDWRIVDWISRLHHGPKPNARGSANTG